MNKQDFLARLRKGLSGLPKEDIEERLAFYSEMIDDRMEEGLSEEDAVSGIGSVDAIISQAVSDVHLSKLIKEKTKSKRALRAWEIVLLILGSPLWISLLLAVIVIILSLYISLWSLIISLWAVFVSFIACALGGVASGIVFAFNGNGLTGVAIIGAGIACAGLAIFMFYGCKVATKSILLLTKKIALVIKNAFIKKEGA